MPYSIVGQHAAQVNGSVSTVDAPAFTPGAGNTLAAFVYYSGSPGGTVTLSDTTGSNGSGWSEKAGIDNNGFPGCIRSFLLDATVATNSTIRATIQNTVGFPAIAVFEISGLAGSSYLDSKVNPQASPGTGTDALTSTATGTLNAQPALILGISIDSGVGGDFSGSAPAAGTGFTGLTTIWDVNGAKAASTRPEHQRVTSTSAIAATATAVTGTDSFVSAVMALAEPSTANLSLPSLGPGVYQPIIAGFAQ